jgi:predicted nucleotidyltransferase
MSEVWRITPEKLKAAVDRVVEACRPRRIILFGSCATGKLPRDSDLDLLVIASSNIENPRKESVRIRRALRGLLIPVDIVVIEENQLAGLADLPGLVYREAMRNGKVVYESAA